MMRTARADMPRRTHGRKRRRAAAARAFDAPAPLTVGVEEELMLLDPATLDLAAARARGARRALDGDARFKLELPAAQIEIVLPPAATAAEAARALAAAAARPAAAAAGDGRARPPRACTRSRPPRAR